MTEFYNLDGQQIAYNPESKIVKTTINEPFFKASKILNWNKPSPGLGLNRKIIDFVLKTKSRLIVHVTTSGHDYWIASDKLVEILKTHNTQYKVVGTTWLCVLPWKDFVGYHHPEVEA